MRIPQAVLLGLLGLAAVSPVPADPPAPASVPAPADASAAHALLANCALRADAKLRGLDALRGACPGVERAVHDLGLDTLLPAAWPKQASSRALADLDALAYRYAGPPPALRLSVSRLQEIALSLKPPPSPPSLWDRIAAWVRSWLQPVSGNPPGWLRFLPHLSIGPRLRRLLLMALAGLIVIGVGAAVVIELRAAGLMGSSRRPGSAARRPGAGSKQAEESSADPVDLASAAPHERPVLLLRLLVQALTRSQRLRSDRNLTCRELIDHARFDTARQREDFGRVAVLAERALYGGPHSAATAIPEEVLRNARALHAQLLAAPAAIGAAAAETIS
ncbi:MAG: hypothetical protein WBE92_04005 [Steroidobacteraceae bacterium]